MLQAIIINRYITNVLLVNVCRSSSKSTLIDYSLVPKLIESDLEERCVRGSGPGGQATNKTSNCVVIKHKPTGIIVKCHANRMMHENKKEAKRLLINKLDAFYNGDHSVENQEKQFQAKKFIESNRRRKKTEEMKKKWIERESGTKFDK